MTQPVPRLDGRTVVLTGAAGRIGRAIADPLASRWDLRKTDLVPADAVAALDVTDAGACRTAFAGADAVVHLAGVPDPEASWEQLLPANVIGVHAVAQAAAVEAEGIDFVVANGISANRYGFAELQQTTQRLGYHPLDDAWAQGESS